jgi:TRAP-type mannitol/chloroaromatic compound transport system permease small subunit
MRPIASILAVIDRISMLAGRLVAVLVPAMVLVLGYEVLARYFFNAPTIWAHDLSILFFAHAGLLAGAYAHAERRHITVDVVYVRLGVRQRATLDALTGLLVFLFAGLVFVYGWEETAEAIRLGARMSTEWAPPRAYLVAVIPVSAGLLLLQQLANWIRSLHVAFTGRELEP